LIIKRMRPELSSDWLDFFDNRAFADHEDWKGCYCTYYFNPRVKEYQNRDRSRREYAKWLIENNYMKGYLCYENGKAIAWCNVNLKSKYERFRDVDTRNESTLAIVCFIVQNEYRRKGIAQKILDRIIKDAKEDEIKIIEAYPIKKTQSQYRNYPGPYEMYIKNGFSEAPSQKNMVSRYL